MSDEELRLQTIDGRALAQQICIQVWNAVELQAEALGKKLRVSDVREDAPLYQAVESVTHYAQNGGELVDEDLNLVIRAVYLPADERSGLKVWQQWDREGEPRTPLETVIHATLARYGLEHGPKVPVAWLAALGSCSVKRLRNLAATKGIVVEGGNVARREAERWLRARSVPGFELRYVLSAAAAKLGRREAYVQRLAELDGVYDPRGPSVPKAWVEKRLAMRTEGEA